MVFNKSNDLVIIRKINKNENRELMAERLFETANAGFKNHTPWKAKHFYHTLETTNSVVFTASVENNKNEKIIGLIIASVAITEADIYMVVVDEEYKKNRIAYQLFEHLIEYLREREVETIYLEVRVSNHPAIGLYETLGFKQVGDRKAYYSSPVEDAIIMRLDI